MYENESEKKCDLEFYQHGSRSITDVVKKSIDVGASASIVAIGSKDVPLSAFDKILYQMKEKHLVKNHDYAHGKRKYENYLATGEDMGIDPWKIAFIRLVEKTKRVQSFARTGITKVKDESIEDTLLDIAILGVITLDMIQASKADTE